MLMAEGHEHASSYPLSHLWIEAELATERINRRIVTDATMMQAVVIASLNPKQGGKHLQKLIRKLNDGQ